MDLERSFWGAVPQVYNGDAAQKCKNGTAHSIEQGKEMQRGPQNMPQRGNVLVTLTLYGWAACNTLGTHHATCAFRILFKLSRLPASLGY